MSAKFEPNNEQRKIDFNLDTSNDEKSQVLFVVRENFHDQLHAPKTKGKLAQRQPLIFFVAKVEKKMESSELQNRRLVFRVGKDEFETCVLLDEFHTWRCIICSSSI